MLPPGELEGKVFRKVMKGYSTEEVDEHFDFIIEKYKELYRAYNELEKKYTETRAELLTYRENEESIRQTLENSQTSGARMVREAEERSDIILRTAKEECDSVIGEFRTNIREEMKKYRRLCNEIAAFKADIFSRYEKHIEYLESIAPGEPESEETLDQEADGLIGATIGNIVVNANRAISEMEREEATLIRREKTPPEKPAETEPAETRGPVPEEKKPEQKRGTSGFKLVRYEEIPSADDAPEDGADGSGTETEPEGTAEEPPHAEGDTMKYRIVPDLPPEMSSAEDIIFGSGR